MSQSFTIYYCIQDKKLLFSYCNDIYYKTYVDLYVKYKKLKLSLIFYCDDMNAINNNKLQLVYKLYFSECNAITHVSKLYSVNEITLINCKNIANLCELRSIYMLILFRCYNVTNISYIYSLCVLRSHANKRHYGLHLLKNINAVIDTNIISKNTSYKINKLNKYKKLYMLTYAKRY